MKISILLYPEFTALDCIGPYEVLSRLPEAQLRFVAKAAGPVQADTGMLTVVAEANLADEPAPDIVLIPGGPGSGAAAKDPEILGWIRKVSDSARWMTSVCTGSEILGAAGLLKNLDATTHWAFYDRIEAHGARAVAERVVVRGKVITAAGVSAGIDMALVLAAREVNEDFAKTLQLAIEYDPDPPFDTGSPAKAEPAIVALAQAALRQGAAGA